MRDTLSKIGPCSRVELAQPIQVLLGALLSHLNDPPADFEGSERLPRVVTEQGDPRVPPHVLLLPETTHRVDHEVGAVEVTPYYTGVWRTARHDRRQDCDPRAVREIEEWRGYSVAHLSCVSDTRGAFDTRFAGPRSGRSTLILPWASTFWRESNIENCRRLAGPTQTAKRRIRVGTARLPGLFAWS